MKIIENKERKIIFKTPFFNVIPMYFFLLHAKCGVAPISYNATTIERKWQWWESIQSVVMRIKMIGNGKWNPKWVQMAHFIAKMEESEHKWRYGHLSLQLWNLAQDSLEYIWHLWWDIPFVGLYDTKESTWLRIRWNLWQGYNAS